MLNRNRIITFVVLLIAVVIGNFVYKLNKTEPVLKSPEIWWGSGDPTHQKNQTITPFKINVSNQVLEDLRYRLKNARVFVPPLEGVEQQYGINTNLLKDIVDFWLTKYNWREREKFLNQFPQFKTKIEGLEIHYIHVKPKKVPNGIKTLPLLILNGWPSSIVEFYEIIPLLTTVRLDKDFVFEVIVPSLPGFGFSQAAIKPGLGSSEIAVVFKNLMHRLGFQHYYVHGSDWGSSIASYMAIRYPAKVKGIHLTLCFSMTYTSQFKLLVGSFWPSLIVNKKNKHKLYPLSDFFSNVLLEFGYMHLQATKPDTVGVSLTDSPVGLAAYILAMFSTWTNPEYKNRENGGLLEKYAYEKLLDNVMIYWITNTITTSMRIYAESINKKQNVFQDRRLIPVPTACAIFDKEIMYQPATIFSNKFPKLVQVNEYSGGHFPALEVPDLLAKDIWLAVSKFESSENKRFW